MKENKLGRILRENGSSISTRISSRWATITELAAYAGCYDYIEYLAEYAPLTVEDYAAFYADQKVEVESKAKTQGVLSEARTQAKLAVRNLLTPVMAEEWELEIK